MSYTTEGFMICFNLINCFNLNKKFNGMAYNFKKGIALPVIKGNDGYMMGLYARVG